MKNWQHKLFLGLLCCAFLVFGWQNRVLAEGMTSYSTPVAKTQLSQLEVTQNVYDYLLQYQPETYNILTKKLAESIEDAKQPLADEVVNNLLALSPNNPQVKWRENNGKIEYLMSTWKYTSSPSSDWPIGTKKLLPYQTWFTAVPQVKEFCQKYQAIDSNIPDNVELSLRLQQYLGLILNKYSTKTHFVEMWVKAEDLTRPCIDAEINDASCNLLPLPVPDSSPVVKAIYTNSYTNAKKEYYPWSGLGYTYDWGNSQKPHQGPSEFIINPTPEKPVEVEVASVTPTQEYCRNQILQ
ncbi:hypothetical protein BMF77_01409 [Dolichospermum sp. UHCC 0315A]|jgi:hypothetical protein|uniref:Uncharacterized protein n=1 Tax=Dolichospermum flos-aquae CCAP 1403/13F TaxID=315271 RepID=A0A6H2BYT5_DOLFA|nr:MULTISPECIES: hypothetical protein [Dolichospermum]MBO1049629.1 hypothetical protein [Dolichospermum sp. DEX182a]MBS9390647.1 hypothetical protein [Dolichospermum sp. WA123]OBQ41554.1 MAG: hypothetical protein AN485_01960 [Anabaena sp. MDT14b]QSV63111.1 MAG: hypothetical protein HEQ26_10445 [Dolichospermum sp. DL01]MDB9450795.1 hypothetical protein [Dolichospermum circinale CS-547]